MQYYDCYAASYSSARRKFLAAADEAKGGNGGTVTSYVHPDRTTPQGEPLAIDVACFGDTKAPRQALFISGTHGQEGFSGSSVQVGWMKSGGPARLPPGTGAVLVHGLNPYGFAHFTRTTENNVDLNRNFIDRNGAPPENARVDGALAAFSDKHGRDALFDTLARGQYRHKDGLMFGGSDREWSNRTLETVVQKAFSGAEKVAFIDWHTGIGEYGKPFFLCFNEADSALFQRACDWWGKENVDGVRPHGMARPNYTGLVFHGVQRFLGNREMCGAVIEFGTRGLGMGRVLRMDQWLRRQKSLDADVRAGLQGDMMDAFCPFDGQWRKDTFETGLKLTDQALKGLAAW